MYNENHWEREAEKLSRPMELRGFPKKAFLIVCEGGKTEPNYFNGFPCSTVKVHIYGIGANTGSVVQEAIRQREMAAKYRYEFDEIWCVFDRDSFPSNNFNRALALAKKENIKVAYSNEAFELWYLLHFNLVVTRISRSDYPRKLTRLLKCKYRKNNGDMYKTLLDKQPQAIKFAKKLLSSYEPINPAEDNPSTTVFKLVEELNKHLNK
jgi:hypothetical protein